MTMASLKASKSLLALSSTLLLVALLLFGVLFDDLDDTPIVLFISDL